MKKIIIFVMTLLLSAFALVGCGGNEDKQPSAENDGKMKVAFLYGGVVGDYGWFYGHDVARKETEAALDFVQTSYIENVQPGAQAERVMMELAADGYEVIVPASADYEADVLKVAPQFPDVNFLLCTGSVSGSNIESFYPETTQMWYILGKIAAKISKTGTLGMVGAVTNTHDLQIQNAWLLGAQTVNPDAKLRVIFINSYYDPAAEKDAALSLIDADADVIAQATNTPAHVQAAEENGVYAMSQFEDMSQFGPNSYITGESLKWSQYYIPTLQKIKDGTFVPNPTIAAPDIFSGTMEFATFGPMMTDELKAIIDQTMEEMKTNPTPYWMGPIYDNNGTLRCEAGKSLTYEDLVGMNWWVKGTISSVKSK